MDIVEGVASNTTVIFASLSFDTVLFLALAAFFFVWGLRAGKTRLINVVLSFYIAALLLVHFPYRESIALDWGMLFGKFTIVDLLLLLVTAGAVQIVVGYVLELEYEGKMFRNSLNNILLSISATIAFLSSLYITRVVAVTDSSTSYLDAIYASEQYLFLMLILPLVGVFVVAR